MEESKALPDDSEKLQAIQEQIDILESTRESAEVMLEEAEAALKIQAVHRGRISRREVDAMRRQKHRETEEQRAALKIQSVARGKEGRKEAEFRRAAPQVASQIVSMHLSRLCALQEEMVSLPAISEARRRKACVGAEKCQRMKERRARSVPF